MGGYLPRGGAGRKVQWAAWVAYDGAAFHGMAAQRGLPTVEGALRARLAALGVDAPWAMSAAARTDAGVGAAANLVTWRHAGGPAQATLAAALRGPAGPADDPEALVVRRAIALPRRAMARAMVARRHYRYRLRAHGAPDGRRWVVGAPLDVDAMAAAAAACRGQRDFAAARAAGCHQRRTVRCLIGAAVAQQEDGTIVIDLLADGFLRRMARLLVGLWVAVGRGALTPSAAVARLESHVRLPAHLAAPAAGLCLVGVVLRPPWDEVLAADPEVHVRLRDDA